MSDFAQAGSICTLQRLNEAHGPALEEELTEHACARPVALVIPCHAADLAQPALRHICAELRGAPWLSEIVISLNGYSAQVARTAGELFLDLPARLLWNDAPAAEETLRALLGAGPLPHGKGLNVWSALGVLAHENRVALVATQDADVSTFRREALVRLCAPCLHPRLGFAFAKMYYSRVADRLYGRVSRLFFAPLLQAVLRVAGHQPLLDFLFAFRYPLAGEAALTLELARALPGAPGWGLETAMLCEVFRRAEPSRLCQVDGGSRYDHRHHPALAPMGAEIAATLLDQLAREGCRMNGLFRRALGSAFRQEGELALRRSEALALMNGLPFDASAEGALFGSFAAALAEPRDPPPVLPPWSQLAAQCPEATAALAKLAAAVP